MIHPLLSVSAMCTIPWAFERDLAFWAEMGLTRAGLYGAKLWDDPQGKMARLSAAGIRASTMIVDAYDLGAPASWEKTFAQHRAAIDLLVEHGGLSIYFTPGRTTGARWRDDLDRLTEAVAPTVAYGRANRVKTAIEPSIRTSVSFVNTLRDAIDVAERTGLHLIADFGNMWMERDFRETLTRAMPHVALIQICDVVIGSRDTPPPGGRAHIDAGELPIDRMIRDAIDAGYTGVFDLEVVPADVWAGCDEAGLRQGIAAASDLLTRAGLQRGQ